MGDLERRETVGTVEIAVELTAAVWFAGSVGHLLYSIAAMPLASVFTLLFAGTVAVLGEQFRVHVTGSQEHAPVTEGVLLALALTPQVAGSPGNELTPPSVIVAAGLATAIGCLLHARRSGARLDLYYIAVRVHMIMLAAVAFHWVPVLNGLALHEIAQPIQTPWVLAALVGVLASSALLISIVLGALHRSSSVGMSVGSLVLDEVEVLWYLHLTTLVTALIMALSAHVLGVWSFLVMVMPQFLVQLAMRRKASVQDSRRRMVRALATLPEVSGYVSPGHVGRVADLATGIGRMMRLSEREILELEHVARLHDVGQVGLRIPLPGGATVEAAPRDQQAIASNSARILAEAGDPPSVLTVLEQQAASYRRMRELGEEIPLAARILKVANAFDDFSQGRRDARFRETAIERISLGLGYEYDPQVFQALMTYLGTQVARPVIGRR